MQLKEAVMSFDSIRKTLIEAIETGEIINIIYHGGSEPGASRMISPIRIDGDIVMARCTVTNKVKGFSLSKLELANGDQQTYTGLHPREEVPIEPDSFLDGIKPYLPELSLLGWTLDLNEEGIGLYECFKNGKPRKLPTLYLYFDSERKLKPWVMPAVTFKYFVRAIDHFMDEARKHAPNHKV
jgi:hypothetical protein